MTAVLKAACVKGRRRSTSAIAKKEALKRPGGHTEPGTAEALAEATADEAEAAASEADARAVDEADAPADDEPNDEQADDDEAEMVKFCDCARSVVREVLLRTKSVARRG